MNTEKRHVMRPTQILALGFFVVVLVGTGLLMLPLSSANGKSVGLLPALFTSASCTCVTGLSVVEVGLVFSTFGQAVMLLLIQIGGLGFMTAAALLFLLMGKRITLKSRLTLAESFNEDGLRGLVRLVRRASLLTLTVEGAGTLLLSAQFIPLFGWGRGIWYGLFHSISAFCNAGFDLFGNGDSIGMFRQSPTVLLTLALLIILGGMGFALIADVGKKKCWAKLTLHSKAALTATGFLLLVGTVLFTLNEWNNPATLGGLPVGDKLVNGFFQSTTLRTAGFASLDQSTLRNASLLLCFVFMFIGANPASTGGGIKTTTMFVLLLQVVSVVRGKEDLEFAGRRLPVGLGRRAMAIICIAVLVVLVLSFCIGVLEADKGFTSTEIVYESISAFATVGNSMGITARLSPVSQLLLILTMFCGRVGPLTLALAFAGKSGNNGLRWPEERIMVG